MTVYVTPQMLADQDYIIMKHISLSIPHYIFKVTLIFPHIPGIHENIIYTIMFLTVLVTCFNWKS